MIELNDFQIIMADMAEVLGAITERQLEIYYQSLKGESPTELKRAVVMLMETYQYKRFPLLAEVWEAIRDVQARSAQYEKMTDDGEPDHQLPPPPCLCSNDPPGFRLVEDKDGYTTAVYCSCEKGQRLKATHEAYFERKRRANNPRRETHHDEGQ